MSTDPLAAVRPGEFRTGVVTALTRFGAFLDVGGVTGLARREELSWRSVDDAREVAAIGDELSVQVLEVDLDGERMVLSAKAAQVDPWVAFARDHHVGDAMPGEVAAVTGSAVQVVVAGAVEGTAVLAPELAADVAIPARRQVQVRITELDPENRYVSFSLLDPA